MTGLGGKKSTKKVCLRDLVAANDQSAPDALYSGEGPKEMQNKEESNLAFNKESFRSVLKDLPSAEKVHSEAKATWTNQAPPDLAAFGGACINIFRVIQQNSE